MRRVLVTGASGFVGTQVLPLLVERGFEVHGISRSRTGASGGIAWHRGDLGDHAGMGRLVRELRPSHVLHLAWETSHGSYYTTPRNADWLRDSIALARTCVDAGVERIVAAGTGAEYDLHTGRAAVEDETPLKPNGLYPECKLRLHEAIVELARPSGVEVAWGRVFFCYGPGEHPARPIPKVIQDILAGGRVPFQAGKGIRDYLHVRDAADAFATLVDGRFQGAVNVGSGEGVPLRDLVARFAAAAGRPDAVDFGAVPTPSYEPAFVVADPRRMRERVGWRPRIGLDEGIRATVAWWRR